MKKSLLVLLAVAFVSAASTLNAGRCCSTKCEEKSCCPKVCKPCKTEGKEDLNCKPCTIWFAKERCDDEEPNCVGGTCSDIGPEKYRGDYNREMPRSRRFDRKRAMERRQDRMEKRARRTSAE